MIESLNCPNCAAAVESDSAYCGFCRSRLKTVACETCLGLMFLGAAFCTHCGRKAVKATVSDAVADARCPRCRRGLQVLTAGEVSIRECERCGGIWCDRETFESLCRDNEKEAAIFATLSQNDRPQKQAATISYVPCPDCGALMNRSNFARNSGVIIDTCREHGIWFDDDELPKATAFIRSGGLEIVREREKIELREKMERLRDEKRRTAMQDVKHGMRLNWQTGERSKMKKLLDLLFD